MTTLTFVHNERSTNLTGFSILTSGHVQLESSLAAYQWQFIVEMAWFSCLTHLACLTLLWNHLSRHTSERLWRLFAMGALATLVTYGLFSTANNWWISNDYHQGLPAICHLGVSPRPPKPGLSWYNRFLSSRKAVNWAFWSNLVSILLNLIGFTSRVIKLYRTLSVNIFGRARLCLSAQVRHILRVMFIWSSRNGCKGSLKRSLIYPPLLALFLTVRFIIDGWTSVLCEVSLASLTINTDLIQVCWLITAFIWGVFV
ncbi:uncharacterized protein N7473_009485 [Penicillium subrubescens]|uniref:uncharacterized protein n=1 Tax=Penicillium subrubescens TaxID=1316194 RepID=UPI00254509EE|nr:uncharacterized protein N7473_009485 [Penicillium subrubescens]KAJ5886811.1 hypothetical protein N7473_009485 [Penicillium subrubescens]